MTNDLSLVHGQRKVFISSLPDDNKIDRVMAELLGFDKFKI